MLKIHTTVYSLHTSVLEMDRRMSVAWKKDKDRRETKVVAAVVWGGFDSIPCRVR